MCGEILRHPGIDIVRIDRVATLGEDPRVDSRSGAKVEQASPVRRYAQDQFLEGVARTAIRLPGEDLADICGTSRCVLQVPEVGVSGDQGFSHFRCASGALQLE
jgi:hypothetical protein